MSPPFSKGTKGDFVSVLKFILENLSLEFVIFNFVFVWLLYLGYWLLFFNPNSLIIILRSLVPPHSAYQQQEVE